LAKWLPRAVDNSRLYAPAHVLRRSLKVWGESVRVCLIPHAIPKKIAPPHTPDPCPWAWD